MKPQSIAPSSSLFRSLRLTASALSLAWVVGAAAPGHAGHYRLPVANFIEADEAQALSKAGIRTTLSLLEEVKTAAQRKRVAQLTGLTTARVDELARQVDLLRIDGIGPGVVRLLNAAGVAHTKALAGEGAAALLARMTAVNAQARFTNVLPQEAQIAAWVAAAQRLSPALEGLL